MASTSSLGANTSTNSSEAQQFYHEFNKKVEDLRSKLELADSTEELQNINSEIIEARTILTNNTHILPTYDQRTHEQNLKRVNEYLQLRRLELKPKARFAFKRTSKPSRTNKVSEEAQHLSSGSSAVLIANDVQHTSFDRISDRKDEQIIPKIKPQSDLHLLNLQGCIVDLRANEDKSGNSIQALQLRDLHNCVIYAGRIDGSVMVHDCQNCLFVLECRQFRMHSSQNIFVFISTKSIATIEHCTDISFGPAIDSLLEKGKEMVEDIMYDIPKVQDFDHISTLTPSPNWNSMGKEHILKIINILKGQHQNAKLILSALFL